MSRSLSEYDSDIIRLYRVDNMERGDIAAKLGIPVEYVFSVIKIVFGVTEPIKAQAPETKTVTPRVSEPKVAEMKVDVNASLKPMAEATEKPKTQKKTKKQVNPEERAKKLAVILEKRSDETFKDLTGTIRSEEEAFSKKDKAFLQLQLIYNPEYRQTYEAKYGLTGVDDIIKENGMEKAIRPVTKKEQQALENVKKYFEKLVEAEQEQKGKKIKPLYLKEAGE